MPNARSALTLEQRIARAEERIGMRRDRLEGSLHAIGERSRDTAASPKVLLAAVAAGFIIDRLGRGVHRSAPATAAPRKAGMAGLFGALAVAVLRQVIGSPGSWAGHAFRYAWQRGRQGGYGGAGRARTGPSDRASRARPQSGPIPRQGPAAGADPTATVPGSTVLG